MNEKVLVRVKLPMADMAYDARIPLDVSAGIAVRMLIEMFEKLRETKLPVSASPALWMAGTGRQLDSSATLRELCVKDGDLLMIL